MASNSAAPPAPPTAPAKPSSPPSSGTDEENLTQSRKAAKCTVLVVV
jgi:hypothetical protein